MTSWTQILDSLENQLHRQQAAFRKGAKMPSVLLVDPAPEPMSDSERVRAIDLMQRTDALLTETLSTLRAAPKPKRSPYS